MQPLLSSLMLFLSALSIPVLSEFDAGSETTIIVSDSSEEAVKTKTKSLHVKPTNIEVKRILPSRLKIEDVFPEECPTEGMSTEAVLFCRARVAWERSVNRLFPKTTDVRKFEKLTQTTKRRKSNEKRVLKKADGNEEDCLIHRRTEQRPYPHRCYGRGNFTWEAFANQWQMIRGDLMYTFDFVLYDKNSTHRKENQLWYLISYLKELASNVDNPIDLVEAVKVRRTLKSSNETERRNKLLKRNFKALSDRVERLETLVRHTNGFKS